MRTKILLFHEGKYRIKKSNFVFSTLGRQPSVLQEEGRPFLQHEGRSSSLFQEEGRSSSLFQDEGREGRSGEGRLSLVTSFVGNLETRVHPAPLSTSSLYRSTMI
jgi:hypothetical protein